MKIVIAGGTGQVGTVLARAFHRDGHSVVVLSRTPKSAPWPIIPWDGRSTGSWTEQLEGADAVINLVGRSVNCRYHAENRRRIIDSRVDSTRIVRQAIAKATQPPRVWLQASTATIYEHRFDAPNDEFTGILGGSEPNAPNTWRFSIDVATAWEKGSAGCFTVAAHSLGAHAFRDHHESGLRRSLRYVAEARPLRPRRPERQRAAVCLVDS